MYGVISWFFIVSGLKHTHFENSQWHNVPKNKFRKVLSSVLMFLKRIPTFYESITLIKCFFKPKFLNV